MGARLTQLAIENVGTEGLNTEISVFQQALNFALVADNCVIDRVGRLASREAFGDYVSDHDLDMNAGEQFDVVRIVTMEPDGAPHQTPVAPERDAAPFSMAKYGVGRYSIDLYSLDSRDGDTDPNVTFCLVGIGRRGVGEAKGSRYGSARYGEDLYSGLTIEYTAIDRYVGAVLEGDKLKTIPQIRPSHGVTDAQLVPFRNEVYVFSKGDGVMVYDNGVTYKLSAHPDFIPPQDETGVIADEIDGDIAIAAYGRLWVSGVNNDYDTIYYSDLLQPHRWYDGTAEPDSNFNTAGIINVSEYWPNGNDRIKGIAAHNGFLVVFGRQSILIYSGVQGDPAGATDASGNFVQGSGLQLHDAIKDVGLVNQDALCNIGTDQLFVDSLGVRSLGRVIQERSSPIGEPSFNVASVIREKIANSRDTVRLMHFPSKSKAVCVFPSSRDAYCFQLGQPSSTGGLKATRWTGVNFFDSCTYRSDYKDRELLAGRDGGGVLIYDGYTQGDGYKVSYESTVLMSGQGLMQSMIPKTITYSYNSKLEGLRARWGFGSSELNYSRFATRGRGGTDFKSSKVNANGSGEMLRVGFDVDVQGEEFSMQQISVNALVGRVMV